ncbi:MAG: ankyrin repeat domain-containing protein [Planctomycetota bacterium]|jgi:ankyrin repeat protein
MKRRRPKRRHLAFSALEAGDLDMLRLKLAEEPDLAHVRDLNGMSLLMAALYRGQKDAVEMLLETALPPDAIEAAALGRTDRLRELLDGGEAGPEDFSPVGFGLLHLACFFGQREAAELLLDRGAELAAVSRHPMGVRPVHSAAASRHWDLVGLCLDRGEDVNATQGGGWTLLHHAAQQGKRDHAEMLLSRGADASVRNDRGQTPADVARERGNEELADLLS